MEKKDIKRELKHLYNPSAREVLLVDVPPMQFLMIDGHGDPNTSKLYAEAVGALFGVSYALKFMVKKGSLAVDYGVMPLEGLWWVEDMSLFSVTEKDSWQWTAMIMQPSFITQELVGEALAAVKKKKNLAILAEMRCENFHEGTCAQIMHIGPFSEEGPTIEKIHQFIETRGRRSGKHHEIYLSDIRKAAPAKWKTIIRQPLAVDA